MHGRSIFLVALLLLMPMSQFIDVSTASSGRAMACSGDICLSETMPNPNGYDNATWPGGEWVELHNTGTTDISILNWQLTNKASKTLDLNSVTIVGYDSQNSSSWTISAGDYMLIARNGTPQSQFYIANSNDVLDLFDSSGTRVDQASWNGSNSGSSKVADPANAAYDWINEPNPSPGQANGGGVSGLIPSDLIISEVMPNPWPSFDNSTWPGGEWIEISNTGTSTMDLTGWKITDAAGNELLFNETHLVGANAAASSYEILAGENRIIAINGSSFYGVLNNGGETLTLHWPNGTDAQQISW